MQLYINAQQPRRSLNSFVDLWYHQIIFMYIQIAGSWRQPYTSFGALSIHYRPHSLDSQ